MSAPYPQRYPLSLPLYFWPVGIPLLLIRLPLVLFTLFALTLAVSFLGAVNRLFRRELIGLRRLVGRGAGRVLGFFFGCRIRRSGRSPARGSLVISNHRSWFDALLYLGDLGARFVVTSHSSGWPLIGFLIGSLGNIYINNKTYRDIVPTQKAVADALARGETFMFFPEAGTADGDRELILPFKPALLETAAREGLPVCLAALELESCPGWPPASVMVAWADWTPFLLHALRLMMMPFFTARVTYLEPPLIGNNRKEMARTAYERIGECLNPRTRQ